MRHTVEMPRVGETVDEVVILAWLVSVGDTVAEGAPLVSVETDKVEVEIPSPVAGTVAELYVAVDDDVPTGAPICAIDA